MSKTHRSANLDRKLPAQYAELLSSMKRRIQSAQVRAAFAVNRELIELYWELGKDIATRFEAERYGTKIVDRLAADLRRAFPGMKGFAARNLRYMRAFAEAWPTREVLQQPVAKLPWGHVVRLLDKSKGEERNFYAMQAVVHGWSRDVLVQQIETNLFARNGGAITNFTTTLPPPQSELAKQTIKDPYNFDFLALTDRAHERELEHGLVEHIRSFLLELGVGFAFVGSQYRLSIGEEDFYVDLLFYHFKLRCFVVFELKKMGSRLSTRAR